MRESEEASHAEVMVFMDRDSARWISRWAREHRVAIHLAEDRSVGSCLLVWKSAGRECVARLGEWVVRDADGRFYAMSSEAFEAAYELVGPARDARIERGGNFAPVTCRARV